MFPQDIFPSFVYPEAQIVDFIPGFLYAQRRKIPNLIIIKKLQTVGGFQSVFADRKSEVETAPGFD